MAKLEIYGRTSSVNVQKLLWVCEELNIGFTRYDAGMKFAMNKENPEYLKLNPNGLVPTIRLGEFVLWESNACLRYLFNKFAKEERKGSLEHQALVDQWVDWSNDVNKLLTPIFVNLIRTPEKDRNLSLVKTSNDALGKTWAILDRHLADKKTQFVVGDTLTIADITIGSYTYRYFNLKIERPSLPNVEAYYQRLQERPGFKKFVITELI